MSMQMVRKSCLKREQKSKNHLEALISNIIIFKITLISCIYTELNTSLPVNKHICYFLKDSFIA